jgi:hypothetical protein
MVECLKNGDIKSNTAVKDLEADFIGLVYSKCEGLHTLGAAKNIYEEKYSDSDELRVLVPEVILREATTVKLTLFFVGADRYSVRDDFNNYIKNGFHKYWDNARKRMFQFYVSKELPIGEEKWYGSEPYLKCEYTLNNIHGETVNEENNPFFITT